MTKRYKKRDDKIVLRLAHALAWDMSIGKASTPRRMYNAQTTGCQGVFDIRANELLPCLRRAGLVVSLREDR